MNYTQLTLDLSFQNESNAMTSPQRRSRREMKAKRTAAPRNLRKRRRRNGPRFTLTRARVIKKCCKKHHRLICAGQVLALMDLMMMLEWTTEDLAEHSGVSRSMISSILNLERFPTIMVLYDLVHSMGFELHEFDLMAKYEVEA